MPSSTYQAKESHGGSYDTVFEVKDDTAPDPYCGNHLTPFVSQETFRENPPFLGR